MADLWVNIRGAYLDKTRKDANARACESEGEDKTDSILYEDLEGEIEEFKIEEGLLQIAFQTPLGYFSFDYELDKDDRMALLQDSIRLINKFKTALEALK